MKPPIWKFGTLRKKNGMAIVTKDSDFNDLAILGGLPPKVIWIRVGNCRVDEIVAILRGKKDTITGFLEDDDSVILEL